MGLASIRNTVGVRHLLEVRQASILRTNQIFREKLESVKVPQTEPLSQADAESVFADLHAESEAYYDGEGGWESLAEMGHTEYSDADTPCFRGTARRVLAYLAAYETTEVAIYKVRAEEGLAFLLANQSADGRFDTQGTAGEVARGRSDRGDAYPTALAGRALVEGYDKLGDTAYLAASQSAGNWEISGAIHQDETNPLESLASFKNANHVGFIIWHLAAHHKVQSNATFLERALWGARQLLQWQIKDGGESDGTWYWYEGSEEKKLVYHSITLRGLLEVYSALEAKGSNADDKVEIETAIFRALNYLIRWQMDDGYLPWSESYLLKWAAGPEVLSVAYNYFDGFIKEQLQPLIFKLVSLHKQNYDAHGTSSSHWAGVCTGDTRHHLILNFGQYLKAFYC